MFYIVNYYNEFDPKAAAWLRELIKAGYIPKGDVDERSIADVHPGDLAGYTQCHFFAGIGGWSYALQLAGWPSDRHVWTGSCPCQPFSSAGTQRGKEDARHLWPEWFRLISQCKPTVIFGEQVERAIAKGWLDEAFLDLEGAQYACAAAVLPALSVESPQQRDRVWFVANSYSAQAHIQLCKPCGHGGQSRQTVDAGEKASRQAHWPSGDNDASRLDEVLRKADEFYALRMDYGLSNQMGLMRGYGNAIVPEVAAEFIQAADEAYYEMMERNVN